MREHAFILMSALAAFNLAARSYAEDEEQQEDVWGSKFRGLALSARPISSEYWQSVRAQLASEGGLQEIPVCSEYRLGQKVVVRLKMHNFGDDPFVFIEERPSDYRLELFDEAGAPVAKTRGKRRLETMTKKEGIRMGACVIPIAPNDEFVCQILLNDWFNIEKEGTYFLVVILRLKTTWDQGFLVSSLVRIKITKESGGHRPE